MPKSRSNRRAAKLFKFDRVYVEQFGLIAGVDEAGCGPLAGPVVAAAVILPITFRASGLRDSKLLNAAQRAAVYQLIQRAALAMGVGVVEADEIDRVNIRQAGFAAMRIALSKLIIMPVHVLVDGFRIPQGPASQLHVIDGDKKSAHIAAASIIAKVTRDAIMERWDTRFPAYGFKRHKGYGTKEHMAALRRFGPSPIHRHSYAPVRLVRESFSSSQRE